MFILYFYLEKLICCFLCCQNEKKKMDAPLPWLSVSLAPVEKTKGRKSSLCERRSRGIPDNVTGGGVPAPPVGPSQLLRCNQILLLLSLRLPALFEVISGAGKKEPESNQEGERVTEREGLKGVHVNPPCKCMHSDL